MIASNKARNAYDKLARIAVTDTMSGSPSEIVLRERLRKGELIPDRCLPGRLLAMLTDEERNDLKSLKASDLQDRP